MLQLSPYYKIISLVLTGVSFKTANVRMDVKHISMLSNFMNATPITFYKILCTTMKNDFKNSPEACVLVHWQKQLHAGVNIKTLSPIYVPHMYISVLKMYTARRSSFRVHFPRSPITVMPVVSVGERRPALHVVPPFPSCFPRHCAISIHDFGGKEGPTSEVADQFGERDSSLIRCAWIEVRFAFARADLQKLVLLKLGLNNLELRADIVDR